MKKVKACGSCGAAPGRASPAGRSGPKAGPAPRGREDAQPGKKLPRVLLLLSVCQKASRDRLDGVMAYAHAHGPWEIQAVNEDPFFTRLSSLKDWHPDGVICSSRNPAPAELDVRRVPMVFIKNGPLPIPRGVSSVTHNDKAIGLDAAAALLAKGLPAFAYIGQNGEPWSLRRGRSFSGAIRAAGKPCAVYHAKRGAGGGWPDWADEKEPLKAWLVSLGKPCGVLVACDMRARGVLDLCLEAGIRVPEELCVIGVDNIPFICENTHPRLSSIEPDFVQAGWLAAETLDRLMGGQLRHPVHLVHGNKGLVERESSQWFRASLRVAATAYEFIRVNACKGPLSVPDILAHIHVSRRLLEVRFREAYGESVYDAVQRTRFDAAKRLLLETETPLSQIGSMCGYASGTHFANLFRRTFGMTMGEFRGARVRRANRLLR
jgi:LacI family transcriptional regulator